MAKRLAGRQMLEITSVNNEKIKETVKLQQKKHRTETGLFLLEGYKPVFEAYNSGVEIKTLYVTEKHLEKFKFLEDKTVLVNDAVLKKISTTDSVPEAVAVAVQKDYCAEDIKAEKRVLLIENVKDAGNLGTLIRSACAFGIGAVVLCGETVDIYNPKVVRSTVGCLFKLPIVKMPLEKAKEIFKESKFIATVVNHGDIVNPEAIDFSAPFVIMLGSEADGLSVEAVECADIKTTIPMTNKAESLNLSSAGSIVLYISSRC